jgi:hypothetical protein
LEIKKFRLEQSDECTSRNAVERQVEVNNSASGISVLRLHRTKPKACGSAQDEATLRLNYKKKENK